ncbi:MAG TPA: TonB family protein [Blastocatellia bacterium]|nr:TonB family protein [Blastocatellia bacterium]
MFERMILSSSARQNHRLSKFFLGSSAVYILALGVALVVSIAVSRPALVGAAPDFRLHNPAIMVAAVTPASRPSQGPKGNPPPAADYRNVATLTSIQQHPSSLQSNPFSAQPPTLARIDANCSACDPGGRDGGTGNGSGGLTPMAIGVTTAPPPPVHPVRQTVPTIVRVPSHIIEGKAIERVKPDYPQIAKIARVQGPVVVEIIIATDGRVQSAHAVSGHPALAAAAVQAALQWRFEPTFLTDVPVKVSGVITFVFKLSE